MKQFTFFIIIAFLLGNQAIHAQSDTNTSSRLQEQLDEYFNTLIELKQFNGVVLVEKEGEIVFRNTYNLTEDPDSSLFITADHQFDIRSGSKLVAKYAVYQLELAGKLSPNDLVNQYLPDFPNGDIITIQHLMDNQSGLPRELTNEDIKLFELDPPAIIELIKEEELEFPPGSETQYSNLAYQILYYIIGEVSNKSFAQYVQDEIFDPLEMTSSGAHFYTDKLKLKKHAPYHTVEEDQIMKIPHFEVDSKKQAKLFSTVDDLNKLLHALKQAPFDKKLVNKKGIIGHSGGSDGIRSHMETNIAKDYSFIFLANYDAIPFMDIILTMEKIVEGEPYVLPNEVNREAITLSEKLIRQYVGRYDFKDANHITIDIKFENNELVSYQKGEFIGTLYAENDSLFFWDPKSTESFKFKTDKQGNIYAIMDYQGAPWVGTKIQ